MLEKINLIVSLELKIRQALTKAEDNSIVAKVTREKIYALNAEFNLGKYAAYMEMLKILDREKYLDFMANETEKCNEILRGIEKAYTRL